VGVGNSHFEICPEYLIFKNSYNFWAVLGIEHKKELALAG
jgi:hypothetical protein